MPHNLFDTLQTFTTPDGRGVRYYSLPALEAAGLADTPEPEARVAGLLAKVNASETAFEACNLAAEILGGASIMHGHPVEKFLRDAASFLHSDGTNQLCLLRAAEGLAGPASVSLYGF